MGAIKVPLPAKLVCGVLFAAQRISQDEILRSLTRLGGPVDLLSVIRPFLWTDYYRQEMGQNIHRFFVSFSRLFPADKLSDIKIKTNALEYRLSRSLSQRCVNLDPGYLSLSKVVLATTKSHAHRIYMGKGIYEEVTLRFQKKRFVPLEWTYPDYRMGENLLFFESVRNAYYDQIQKKHGISSLSRCV